MISISALGNGSGWACRLVAAMTSRSPWNCSTQRYASSSVIIRRGVLREIGRCNTPPMPRSSASLQQADGVDRHAGGVWRIFDRKFPSISGTWAKSRPSTRMQPCYRVARARNHSAPNVYIFVRSGARRSQTGHLRFSKFSWRPAECD